MTLYLLRDFDSNWSKMTRHTTLLCHSKTKKSTADDVQIKRMSWNKKSFYLEYIFVV